MCESKGPRINSSPIRCPYCHEQVKLRGSPWVACSACLARHHADCWMGQGGCASCLGHKALLPASSLRLTRDRLRRSARPPSRGRALALGALLLSLQLGVVLGGLVLTHGSAITGEPIPGPTSYPVGYSADSIAAYRFEQAHTDLRDLRDELVRRNAQVGAAAVWVARSRPPKERVAVAVSLAGQPVPPLPILVDWQRWQRAEAAGVRVERLTALVTDLESDLASLRTSYANERKRRQELELLMSMHESPCSVRVHDHPFLHANCLRLPEVPAIDGKVTAIQLDHEPSVVLLSVGRDDKVQQGYRFSVYRGSQFIGKVVVEHVGSDVAGCRILFTADGQRIQAGDSAATRLQ